QGAAPAARGRGDRAPSERQTRLSLGESSGAEMSVSHPTFWDIADHLPAGAWTAKRRLAGALRELTHLCVTTDAREAELEAAGALVQAATGALRAQPQRTFADAYRLGLAD